MLRESFSYATSQTPGFPLRKVNDSSLLQTRFHYDIEQLDVFRNRAQLPQERARCRNIFCLDAEARLPFQADARLLDPDHLAAPLRALEQRTCFPKYTARRFRHALAARQRIDCELGGRCLRRPYFVLCPGSLTRRGQCQGKDDQRQNDRQGTQTTVRGVLGSCRETWDPRILFPHRPLPARRPVKRRQDLSLFVRLSRHKVRRVPWSLRATSGPHGLAHPRSAVSPTVDCYSSRSG